MTLIRFLYSTYLAERALTSESARQLEMSCAMFTELFGDVPLDKLTHELLNRWSTDNPRDWSPKTMRRRVSDILAVWTYAYAVGATENRPNRLRVRRVRIAARMPEAWTLDQLGRMVDACKPFVTYMPNGVQEGALLRAVVCVGFYSALRASDLMALRRDQLSADGVAVPQAKKHGSHVLVVTPQWVIDDIDASYPPAVAEVFAWPYAREHFYQLWKRLLAAAGLPGGRTEGLQKLRRSAVTYGELARSGFGAELAGHAGESRTTYQHYVDSRILRRHTRAALPDIRPPK